MNMMKKALLASLLAMIAGQAAAESRISAVITGAMSTTSKLNFAVNVPKILYLRVGDTGATINTVTFTLGLTGLGAVPVSDAMFSGTMPPAAPTTSVADNNGTTTDGAVAVQLWTNNGTSSLTCSGAALTSGANTIALTNITVTNAGAGTLAHPGANLACAAASRGAAGTNNLSDTWTFAYAPAALPAPGSYTTQVTYTASQP